MDFVVRLATMVRGTEFSYLKAGLYRDATFDETAVAWFDAFRIGDSLQSVAPPAPS
jgi:hypothetical protein